VTRVTVIDVDSHLQGPADGFDPMGDPLPIRSRVG
jgi:hypothetical protein